MVNNLKSSILYKNNVANVYMNTIDLNSSQPTPVNATSKTDSNKAEEATEKDNIAERAVSLKKLVSVGEYDIDMDKLGAVLLKNI